METIETLNQRLVDYYGLDSNTGRPMFRIVFADDETEKRLVSETPSGFQLLTPIVAEVKKYPYLKGLYVLERLVIVPEMNSKDLPTQKLSYEPIWAYRDDMNGPIPPVWSATKFIVDSLYAALGKRSMRKYVESEKETTPEGRDQRIDELKEELFGNETDTCDALRYKEGIVVPSNYKKEMN
jgi:hypothetical protein